MRHLTHAVVATALAAALFGSASAAPSTAHLDDLRAFMQTTRDGLLPNGSEQDIAERAALTKALAAMNARSTSLDGDVRMFGKIATAVEALSVPDLYLQLDAAVVALQQDVVPMRDALAARVDAIVPSKLATAAQTSLAAIDAALQSAAGGGGQYALRAKDLHLALTAIATANTRITKGTNPRGSAARPGVGYFACLADGAEYVPTFGSGRVKLDTGLVSEVTLTGYFPSANKGGIEISWSTGSFTGPGVYMLDGTSGALVVMNDRGQTFYTDGTGGQVTVTEYSQVTVTDFDPVKKRIAGTFDAILVGAGDLGGARTITKGTFDVRRYATTGK